MSASSKKKLRNAENAEKLTERQLAEQKEAKKLRTLTIVVVAAVALAAVFAVWSVVTQSIENSGVRQRSTVALTIGDHEISNAELNYYFVDSVNNFNNSYGSYATLFGLDVTKPLDEQIYDEAAGTTWADDFLASAIETATSVYALSDAAEAAGFTLPETEQANIESTMSYLPLYASTYGYANEEDYVKALYGSGATLESLRAYYEQNALANAYYTAYGDSLTYTEADLRAAEAENYDAYSSYSYNYYYLSVSKFLEGGTTDEEGNTTYTDAEQAAAEAAAKAAAASLAGGEYASVAEFDAAIAALSVNADSDGAASSAYEDVGYASISSLYADWITDEARVEGDVYHVASTTTSTDDNGNEVSEVIGYYVVYYVGSTDNNFALANVRHCLVAFEGGTYDSSTGLTTYTDEEKAAAKEAADELYAQWLSGEATEDSFATLANENSSDSDGTDGGLYTDVYPGQMVTNFNDWCFDESRKAGDTGIVESNYGYHIMYYSGDSDTTYRDYLITTELTTAAITEWYTALTEAMTVTEQDTQYISTDLVISAS